MIGDLSSSCPSLMNKQPHILIMVLLVIMLSCLIIILSNEDVPTTVASPVEGAEIDDHVTSVIMNNRCSEYIGPLMDNASSSSRVNSFVVGNISYKISGKGMVTVMGFTGYPASELVIPSDLVSPDGSEYKVVKIANNAFSGMAPVKSVVIPDSVVEMGNNAFKGCVALKNLTIPISVKCPHGSKNHAFKNVSLTRLVLTKGAYGLQVKDNDFWKLWKDSLMELVVDEGIRSITTSFKDWKYLESVTLKNVESIHEDQFRRCDKLFTVTAPDVKRIYDNAFMDCPRLNTVDIPSFESHTRGIFVHCPNLKTVVSDKLFIDNGQLFLLLDDGNLSLIQQLDADAEIIEIPVEVAPPSGENRTVTEIGKEAFREHKNLGLLGIHDGVTMVDEHAFHDCRHLHSIYTPIGIDCSYHTKKTAFEGVTPVSLVLTGEGYDAKGYMDNEFWRPWTGSLTTLTLQKGITDFKTPIHSDKLTGIHMGDVVKIHKNQFKDCKNLAVASIPRADTIGEKAFKNCKMLITVDAPNTKYVENESFSGCEMLMSFTFTNTTAIGDKAFWDTGVDKPENGPKHMSDDSFGSTGKAKKTWREISHHIRAFVGMLSGGVGAISGLSHAYSILRVDEIIALLKYGIRYSFADTAPTTLLIAEENALMAEAYALPFWTKWLLIAAVVILVIDIVWTLVEEQIYEGDVM